MARRMCPAQDAEKAKKAENLSRGVLEPNPGRKLPGCAALLVRSHPTYPVPPRLTRPSRRPWRGRDQPGVWRGPRAPIAPAGDRPAPSCSVSRVRRLRWRIEAEPGFWGRPSGSSSRPGRRWRSCGALPLSAARVRSIATRNAERFRRRFRAHLVGLGRRAAGRRGDHTGHVFVGPAGRVLDDALAEAGIDRKDVYITNVVKHFKFIRKGKRRIHKRHRSCARPMKRRATRSASRSSAT